MTPSEEILSAYLDDELGAQERADVERRLASDAHWRETFEKLQEVRAWVQDLPAVTPSSPKSIVQMLAEQKPEPNETSVRLSDNADITTAPSSWKWMMSLAATSLLLVGTTLWWISGVGQPIALGPTLQNAAPDAPVPAIRSEGASVQSKSPKASHPNESVASASVANPQAEGDNSAVFEEATQRKMNNAANADGPSTESIAAEVLHRDSPAAKSMAAQDSLSPVTTGSALAEPAPADPSATDTSDPAEGANPPLEALNAPGPAGNAATLEGDLSVGSGGLGGTGGGGGSGGFGGGMMGGAPAPLDAKPLIRSRGGAAPAEGGGEFTPSDPAVATGPKAPSPKDSQARVRGGRSALEGAPGLPVPALPAPSPAVGNATEAGDTQGLLEMADPKREESKSDRYALGMQLPAKPLARFLTEKDSRSINSLFFLVEEPNFAKDAETELRSASADEPRPIEAMMRKEDRGVEAGAEAGQDPKNSTPDSTEHAPADAGESGASATSYRHVTDQMIHLTVPAEVFADIEESMSKGELKLHQASSLADSKPGSLDSDPNSSETIGESAVNKSELWLLELSPLSYESLRKRWSEKGFDVTEILDDRRLNLIRENGVTESRDQPGLSDDLSPPDSSANPEVSSDAASPSIKPPVQADFIFILLQGR